MSGGTRQDNLQQLSGEVHELRRQLAEAQKCLVHERTRVESLLEERRERLTKGAPDESKTTDNPWKLAVDYQLNLMESTADSFESPEAAVKAMIDWHVEVAKDPKVNGSASVVDVQRSDFIEEFETWWNEHGQFVRSGGGNYEKTFAFAAFRHLMPEVFRARTATAGSLGVELPEFLLEMAEEMRRQSNRGTAHPFWQTRCKRYLVTEEGYDQHHWILTSADHGEFYRSDTQGLSVAAEFLEENYGEWFLKQVENLLDGDEMEPDVTPLDAFSNWFDFESGDLPDDVTRLYVRETEQVVSTHLTESDAEQFIKRKQHDYPPLYTYVESAYWSPQLRQLQDWLISLSSDKGSD